MNIFKKRAWILDGGILIEGYVLRRTFFSNPDSRRPAIKQRFDADDVGQLVFYDIDGLPYPVML